MHPNSVTPILIGYFPKCTLKRPDWLKAAGVEEVCSVSTCISKEPDGWIDRWLHNEMWVYDSPELAWSVVPKAAQGGFDLYAYQMFPVEFANGERCPFTIPPLQVQPLPVSFERLGFDAVSRHYANSFECSPLSCNSMAEHVSTNRYCLVDGSETAFRIASEFSVGGAEPGPYYVLAVWREKFTAKLQL
jgi:hypothetical protein